MLALINSYQEEVNKIKKRGNVWLEAPNGWFHSYNKEIVKLKISMMEDEITRLRKKYDL